MTEETPRMVKVMPQHVKPLHYALWCSIEDGKPFANEIVLSRWSKDGRHITFMLDTHQFYTVPADELVELVPLTPSAWAANHYKDWAMPARPRCEAAPAAP